MTKAFLIELITALFLVLLVMAIIGLIGYIMAITLRMSLDCWVNATTCESLKHLYPLPPGTP